jgi:hypothetical protein
MDIAFVHDMPIWAEFLVLIIGIIFLWYAIKSLKSGKVRGPWYLLGWRFEKNKDPLAYWLLFLLWFGIGLWLLILGIISLL